MLERLLKQGAVLTILTGCSFSLAASGETLLAQSKQAKPVPELIIFCPSTPQRFNFLPNGYAASKIYMLPSSCVEANFTISAKAGQLMVLVLNSPGSTRVEIKSPDGTSNEQPAGNAGVVFNKVLTATGEYRIKVSKDKKAAPWSGQLILTAVVQPNL
ncbi:hypothetical protein [Altericista sp. CCNU0014]|uniref:hypothetical protein n=1 Tax=Altericista sp. CCNU0014 TaxID=3082949 RepID=UPI00384ED9A2